MIFDEIKLEISKIHHLQYKIINRTTIKEEKTYKTREMNPDRLGSSPPL